MDVNRSYYSDTVIRTKAGPRMVELNKDLGIKERMNRFSRFHTSYFTAMRDMLNHFDHNFAFSIHSFTKIYDTEHGEQERDLEIGILNLHHRNQAEFLQRALTEKGIL